MSASSAWDELIALWESANGVPDLGSFWARHAALDPLELQQLRDWHAECLRLIALPQPPPPPGSSPPAADPPGPGTHSSTRLVRLPPLPAGDRAGQLSFLGEPGREPATPPAPPAPSPFAALASPSEISPSKIATPGTPSAETPGAETPNAETPRA
ncbi:MAG: hypothetical protein ACKO3P_06895, partial [Planctomycetaceae bacterium]